ncbi:8357_t:CDS:2 [Dentiscutata erythropus]|uniref:8357_t:CDS:1 n=1 Tax=Dentiscutata erythropus TaxID=1348616 RepID=A0A9N8WV13_9GLOM|nr:8357_t:CDS:2 [Dentiscutata erythropus]
MTDFTNILLRDLTQLLEKVSSSTDLTSLDISKWQPEHLSTLKSTIQQCIPLVRIFQISSNDFHSKVMPYKDIIPKALFDDVMRYHMVPDCPRPISLMPSRRGGIESNLLRARHAALISSWIDRNDINAFYNTTNIKAAVLSRVQEPSRAVLCSQAIGACFGSGDLVMGGTHSNFNVELGCSCKRQSYERPLMITNHDRFSVDEYEKNFV